MNGKILVQYILSLSSYIKTVDVRDGDYASEEIDRNQLLPDMWVLSDKGFLKFASLKVTASSGNP